MEFMDVLRTRRTMRAYKDTPVERAVVEQLIQAAILAPSASNEQAWSFGVIHGADKLHQYAERAREYLLTHLDEFSTLERYRSMLSNPDFDVFHGANTLIVIYAKPGAALAAYDCCLAAENLMLAARDMNLGTCWVGLSCMFFNTPEGKHELGVGEDYTAIAPLIIGYPSNEFGSATRKAPEMLFWIE